MKKRLLAALLAAAMVTTMAPAAFAVEDDTDPNNNTQVTENVGAENGTNSDTSAAEDAAAVGSSTAEQGNEDTKAAASNLQTEIDNAAENSTVTMSADTTADITISKNLTLDLGGNTLTNTNAGKATITVANGAAVTVQNGSVVGGTDYYNIQVAAGGALTLEGVTATAGNSGSSMIDNFGTLTINSGTYTGGLNVIKNEPNAKLTVNNGKFELLQGTTKGYTGTIFNYGNLTIHDGEFLQSDTQTKYGYAQVVYTDKASNGDMPSTNVTGGTFKNSHSSTAAWTIRSTNAATDNTTVTGGKFNKKVTSSYLPSGYASTKVDGYYGLATAITSVTLNETEVNLKGGESFRVKVIGMEPADAEIKTYSMSGSGSSSIASFTSSSGWLNAKKAGEYKVTVIPDGADATKAECVFHITDGDAAIGTTQYPTLEKAIAAAKSGQTIKLLNDVDLSGNIVINKNITLDLNGKKIYNTTDIWHDADKNDENDKNIVAMFDIKNGADVTITGNGTVEAKQNDCYNFNIVKGNLTIENGTFMGNVSAVQVQNGHLEIKGGKFDLLQKWEGKNTFLINCIDDAYRDGTAKVSITGGTFVDFNPANCQAEGEGTNFLATGYITTKVGDNYVVKANANKNITDLDTAINTIKGEASSTEKKAAVDVIKNIDNADLANNSAAMGKLAALDNTLTDTTSGSAKVTVTPETESATGIDADEVKVTNAALSADLTSNQAQNVKVTIADGTSITDDAVAAAKEAAGITDAVDVQKLNISMTVNGTTVAKPTAPVVLEFPLPNGWKGCQIVCVDDVSKPEVIPTTVIGDKVKATFNHFSDYAMLASQVITSPNKYQIELTPTSGETTVYAGDTITFDIVLKRIEGNSDTINRFRFTPTSDMLTVTGGTVENGFQYDEASKEFNHLDASNPITLTNGQIKVGTVTCKVNNNATNRRNLAVTVGDQDTVTVAGYQKSNGLTVAEIPVEYDAIRVYFTNYTGRLDSNGNEETERKTFYTSADSKNLYDSLDAMVNGIRATDIPAAVDGSITNGTQYRLTYDDENENLKNWLAADGTTKYVDVVNGTGFAGTMSFYVSRVELLEVGKPDGVTIDSKTTTRGSKTYVDKNADFTFSVPGAATGMKNEVTVTVGGTPVTPAQDAANKNKYTVDKSNMNNSPVTITVNQVIDLDVDDIKVFEDEAGKFLQYSKYSDEDTLVLIKGAAGVKYTLTPDAGTEAPEIYKLPTDHGYGDFNLAVLIPRPVMVTGEDARATMLKYLTDTYHIAVATGDNTSINAYDFDTNADGNGSGTFKLDDAQATYDFGSIAKAQMYWEPSDVELLKADVLTYADESGAYNTPRDGQVTSSDVDAFLYNYVYMPNKRPNT